MAMSRLWTFWTLVVRCSRWSK